MRAVGSGFAERASWLLRMPLETPTIAYDDEQSGCTLWLKLDYLLPSGCTKDRMAIAIVGHAIASGEVSQSTVVVEASSGSTSIALSMVCATVGVRFRAYMPKTVSGERVLMIRRLGGEVVLTPAEEGIAGAAAALVSDSGEPAGQARLLAVRQFENPRNVLAHRHSTGPELIRQVGGRLDGFVAGVGTGGTLMGVAHALRDHGYDTTVAQAVPTTTPTAQGGVEVAGGIPGVVDGMSRLMDPEAVNLADAVLVPESEALDTAREFGRLGLGIGPSAGLNIAAARRLAGRLGPGHHIGTVLPDRMERYFSTALFHDVAAEL
ncbi:MAG: PLP-dependent cysteine synthase family protein [Ornithinibacter sp.]